MFLQRQQEETKGGKKIKAQHHKSKPVGPGDHHMLDKTGQRKEYTESPGITTDIFLPVGECIKSGWCGHSGTKIIRITCLS